MVRINVAAIEIFPLPDLRVGYAYDFSIGPFETHSHGSHEISVGLTRPRVRRLANRQVSSPESVVVFYLYQRHCTLLTFIMPL